MKFDIVGINDSYGSHRFSNNSILYALKDNVTQDSNLVFVWWVEKMFLDPKYSDIADRLCNTDWFGVMHVPLLTPNWAMYSQNNLSKLYFSHKWRLALSRCKGIIVLSEHMKVQLQALYPSLPVFSMKHPIGSTAGEFSPQSFKEDPKLLLVGAWLRDFDSFFHLKTNFRKVILLNKYADGYLKDIYGKYSPDIRRKIRDIDCIEFLENDEYDKLLSSSLVYLGLHETSANNALCECISSSVPFVSKNHPAITEYCGIDYPLFFNDALDLSTIEYEKVIEAHHYLKDNYKLKEMLSIDSFVDSVASIYIKIID